jgi:hypothetical protein
MLYHHKPSLENLLTFTLFLLPITMAASGELPKQVNQSQIQMMENNEKIAHS